MKNSDTLDKDIKKYLQAVATEIHCPHHRKVKFLSQLESSISLFTEENPAADSACIMDEFGSPANIGESFLQEEDTQKLQQKISLN